MKKVFLIAAGIFAFQASAQEATESYKPTKGTLTTEVGLNGGLNNAEIDLDGGVAKFRYFLKDDIALRAGLGINSTTEEYPVTLGTGTEKFSNTTIKLGAEKHFAGTNRLSTYAGAELIFGFGKESEENSFENGNSDSYEQKNSGFGVGIFTGADYYIARKLFLGVEAGLSFLSNKTKDAEFSSTIGGVTTSDSTPGEKGSNIATAAYGGIRVGYQF